MMSKEFPLILTTARDAFGLMATNRIFGFKVIKTSTKDVANVSYCTEKFSSPFKPSMQVLDFLFGQNNATGAQWFRQNDPLMQVEASVCFRKNPLRNRARGGGVDGSTKGPTSCPAPAPCPCIPVSWFAWRLDLNRGMLESSPPPTKHFFPRIRHPGPPRHSFSYQKAVLVILNHSRYQNLSFCTCSDEERHWQQYQPASIWLSFL